MNRCVCAFFIASLLLGFSLIQPASAASGGPVIVRVDLSERENSTDSGN